VGLLVVGAAVGLADVGKAVVGLSDGSPCSTVGCGVGEAVGRDVVGDNVGPAVVGGMVGTLVGKAVTGEGVGRRVGAFVVGGRVEVADTEGGAGSGEG